MILGVKNQHLLVKLRFFFLLLRVVLLQLKFVKLRSIKVALADRSQKVFVCCHVQNIYILSYVVRRLRTRVGTLNGRESKVDSFQASFKKLNNINYSVVACVIKFVGKDQTFPKDMRHDHVHGNIFSRLQFYRAGRYDTEIKRTFLFF